MSYISKLAWHGGRRQHGFSGVTEGHQRYGRPSRRRTASTRQRIGDGEERTDRPRMQEELR